MDSDLTHEALSRFEALEARVAKLETPGTEETETEEDQEEETEEEEDTTAEYVPSV